MIVPQFWAEARVQDKTRERQVTVRRYGWSDTSQEDAQAMAEARAAEALRRILSGEKIERREPKVPYHGAAGMPIREEIVSRHGDTIITRNSYGARCLNTPDVLFADLDFPEGDPPRLVAATFLTIFLGGIVVGLLKGNAKSGLMALVILGLTLPWAVSWCYGIYLRRTGGHQQILCRLHQHPGRLLRIYRAVVGSPRRQAVGVPLPAGDPPGLH